MTIPPQGDDGWDDDLDDLWEGELQQGGGGQPVAEAGPAPWKIRHAVGAFAAGLAASLVASLAVVPGGISNFELFAVIAPVQSLATIAVVALLQRRRGGWKRLGLKVARGDAWGLLIGAGMELALSLAVYTVVEVFFGGEAPVQGVVEAADEAIGLPTAIAVGITTVILAPISEELVFRGILLRSLGRLLPMGTLVLSAAAFALVHLLDLNAVTAVPVLFVVGLVLGHQAQRTGRLGLPIAIHAGFNLVGVLALLLA